MANSIIYHSGTLGGSTDPKTVSQSSKYKKNKKKQDHKVLGKIFVSINDYNKSYHSGLVASRFVKMLCIGDTSVLQMCKCGSRVFEYI